MTLARILAILCAAMALAAAASGAVQAGSRADIKEFMVEEALASTVPPSFGGAAVDQRSES